MPGQRIKHPASTNFDDSQSKRLRRNDSLSDSDGSTLLLPRSDSYSHREVPDSDAESNDEIIFGSQTALEVALPPVKTDKKAIQEYEASRAAEHDSGLQNRLSQRQRVSGKSSIYVDAFNLALDTVLEEEAHLFDAAELAVFDAWRALSYEGQYLYVRLFLRKTVWHRVNRLGYHGDIADLTAAVEHLLTLRSRPLAQCDFTQAPHHTPQYAGDPHHSPSEPCGSFTFADISTQHIHSLEEASSLLKLDELKDLAKDAKIQGKTKAELLRALRRTSSVQTGLNWSNTLDQGVAPPPSRQSHCKNESPATQAQHESSGQEEFPSSNGLKPQLRRKSTDERNRDELFVGKILATTGPCIRLSPDPRTLFERVHVVFYRSTEWTEKSLTTIILARISRRKFPSYIISRSNNIFASRADLLEFEASIRTQFRVDSILESNVRKEGLDTVQAIFEGVYPRWLILLKTEQEKEDRVYDSGEGAYLRRFSPAWVYTRIVHKGVYVLGRVKDHLREYRILCELLNQRLFHVARRGAWYQRKALLEEHYLWALLPDEDLSEEAQKRRWKQKARETCETGLQDQECHLIYHYDLQKRIMKLERALRLPKREQHDFGHVRLARPLERTVTGVRVEQRSGRGTKTVWLDEREGGGECSVEALCLSHYRDLGWKGFHSERGIVRTLFGYLFFDILFTYVPNVFQTAYQTCPLDLHTDAFYPSRASEINHRLAAIENGQGEKLLREVYDREVEAETCIVGVHWDYEYEDLVEIVQCFDGPALATLCKVMAQEYQQRGGGIPDLFLWRMDTKEVMFAEVKSENDRLSDTQRLWIHVLTGAGIRVELCAAVRQT